MVQLFRYLLAVVLDDGVNSGSEHRRDLPAQLGPVWDA
jgi:hypothetical protein